MSLACQRDSFLKELRTTVKSCEPATAEITINGKKQKIKGFEVILNDTVLFPEGGGQPDDRGTINDISVLRIKRHGAEAVNFVAEEILVGSDADLKVDWERRFDNMQQHSGQHLITAMADKLFGFKTTSWSLGEKTSFIELDAPKMSAEQMDQLERIVNEKIRQCLPVVVHVYESAADPELSKVRARGLPSDHTGPVRVISMKDVDDNMCCGTHVTNLSQLQIVKLLGVEKGKRNRVNLLYLTGNRVLGHFSRCYGVEKLLTNVLNGPLEMHVELAEKFVKVSKTSQKSITTLLRELATLEVQNYKQKPDRKPLFIIHRKEGDADYMNAIVREMGDENVTMFVTVGDDKGPGMFLLSGQEDIVSELGPSISSLLDGKGAGKKGRFQGKANQLCHRDKVTSLLHERILG